MICGSNDSLTSDGKPRCSLPLNMLFCRRFTVALPSKILVLTVHCVDARFLMR